MKEFAEIFDLGYNFFHMKGNQMGIDEFVEDVTAVPIDFSQYEKCKPIMQAMMGLRPTSDNEEREAILSALDYNHNIEVRIESII
jgi:hypothetical protein